VGVFERRDCGAVPRARDAGITAFKAPVISQPSFRAARSCEP
jgi:hypothetical protein